MPLSKQLKKKAIKFEVQTAMVDKGVLSLVSPDPVTLSKEKSASERQRLNLDALLTA